EHLGLAQQRVAEQQLDVLFYTDVGMDPLTYYPRHGLPVHGKALAPERWLYARSHLAGEGFIAASTHRPDSGRLTRAALRTVRRAGARPGAPKRRHDPLPGSVRLPLPVVTLHRAPRRGRAQGRPRTDQEQDAVDHQPEFLAGWAVGCLPRTVVI